ncbi:MAG TPA: phage holin family protein [Acidimicrobiales bacterium]|jgi:putative membrane protein
MKWILGWVALTVGVMVTVAVFPGISVDWTGGVFAAIAAVFTVVNLTLGLILRVLSIPLLVLTWGLFGLVINAIVFMVTDWVMGSLHVDSFWAALGGAAVISFVAFCIEAVAVGFNQELARST